MILCRNLESKLAILLNFWDYVSTVFFNLSFWFLPEDRQQSKSTFKIGLKISNDFDQQK